jgi:hypothetical protein
MEAISIVVAAVAILVGVGPGSDATRPTEMPAANASDGTFVLDDGTRLWLAEDRAVPHLREGVTVDLSYEERNGEHVLTSIESAE